MRELNTLVIGAIAIIGLFLLQASPEEETSNSSQGKALKEASTLTKALENPDLSPANRNADETQLFELLSGTGAAFTTYGPIIPPISSAKPDQLPKTGHIPGGPTAKATAWAPGKQGFLPTNDWFQGIAGFPGRPGRLNSTGPYMIQWVGDKKGSLRFAVPVSFSVNGTKQPYILQRLEGERNLPNGQRVAGFTIGADQIEGAPVVQWQETGNMARDVSFHDGDFVMHVVQGAVFQGASYRGTTPYLTLPPGKMTKTTLPDGNVKYEISDKSRRYFVYGNESLHLKYDTATGTLVSEGPYNGNINVASLDANDPRYNDNAALLDAHANAVIVKAQGTLLPNYQYQFAYVSQNLSGHESDQEPLVYFKQHQIDNLTGLASTGLSLTTLTGKMEAYAGSTFVFTVPAPNKSPRPLDALPPLENGQPPLTQAQAKAISDDGSPTGVRQALARASKLDSGASVYNKRIYQQGLTLAYAQRILEIAYPTGIPKEHLDALQAVYNKLKANVQVIFRNLQWDTDYGTIVAGTDDYGNHSYYNDHIVQYSYPLLALTFMKQYADKHAPADTFFTSNVPGFPYTGRQMADLLAADIGETGPGASSPINRNFDVYNSHSWISGTQGYSDGANTESESEAVFGGLTVADWLATSQTDSLQAEAAKTRWAMEVQGLQTYFLIDPVRTVYKAVSPEFVSQKISGSIPPVVSNLFQNKVTSDTFWGAEWDRQLACEFMPAGANLMDCYLNNVSPTYQKLVADYILRKWGDYDMSNPIQSVLIGVVAKTYPDKVAALIQDVQKRNQMDGGTNGFILRVIGEYARNQQASQVPPAKRN